MQRIQNKYWLYILVLVFIHEIYSMIVFTLIACSLQEYPKGIHDIIQCEIYWYCNSYVKYIREYYVYWYRAVYRHTLPSAWYSSMHDILILGFPRGVYKGIICILMARGVRIYISNICRCEPLAQLIYKLGINICHPNKATTYYWDTYREYIKEPYILMFCDLWTYLGNIFRCDLSAQLMY